MELKRMNFEENWANLQSPRKNGLGKFAQYSVMAAVKNSINRF